MTRSFIVARVDASFGWPYDPFSCPAFSGRARRHMVAPGAATKRRHAPGRRFSRRQPHLGREMGTTSARARPDHDPGRAADALRARFNHLWRDYSEFIFALAMKWLRNRETARDICAQTFLKAMLSAQSGTAPEHRNDRAWLATIARRTMLDFIKSRAHVKRREMPDLSAVRSEAESPADRLLAGERAAILQECLESLSETQRKLVVLCDRDDQPRSEVALELRMSVSNVNTTLHRLRSRLRTCVEMKADGLEGQP